jgi:hypothetical protein
MLIYVKIIGQQLRERETSESLRKLKFAAECEKDNMQLNTSKPLQIGSCYSKHMMQLVKKLIDNKF